MNEHYQERRSWKPFELSRIRARAARDGRPCSLTMQDVRELDQIAIRGGICQATGVKLKMTPGCDRYPSLDRIDPKRGYDRDNVRVTTRIFNICRRDFTDDEFARLVAAPFMAKRGATKRARKAAA